MRLSLFSRSFQFWLLSVSIVADALGVSPSSTFQQANASEGSSEERQRPERLTLDEAERRRSTSQSERLVQIIHTNDLHSYFEGTPDDLGGYARVKTRIDQLKRRAENRGIESLILDAGDFGEGNSFFLSDEGAHSLGALGLMEIDAAVIGNHDHLLGSPVLIDQIQRSREYSDHEVQFLSANLIAPDIQDVIDPFVDFQRRGMKLRVIGFSTPEPHFQFPLRPEGYVLPVGPVARIQEEAARSAGADLVIALTHIGVASDQRLAAQSENIDVIIGGHSHTRLDEVLYERNRNGKKVPIVQTGAHGLAVGSLILEVPEDSTSQNIRVVDYQLHDVDPSVRANRRMQNLVEQAKRERDSIFDGRWNEKIGQSKVHLSGYEQGSNPLDETCWGRHMAKMTRRATGADVGVHMAVFDGMMKPPGEVTKGDLVDQFPHFRRYDEPGWRLATFRDTGRRLRTIFRAFVTIRDDYGFNFDGLEWSARRIPRFVPIFGGREWIRGFEIGGDSLDRNREYTVAIPAEVGYAAEVLLGRGSSYALPNFTEFEVFAWDVMEEYVQENSPIDCDHDLNPL